MKKHFALLGEHLGHSFSPQIHHAFGEYEYKLVECGKTQLSSLLHDPYYDGFNITIPYKKEVVPFLDELSSSARDTGSVNTVLRLPDGRLFGDNTDVYGFTSQLLRSKVEVKGRKALVLGSGGAGASARHALETLGANVVTISRNGENNYTNLDKHFDASVIVNATPVGMYPNNGISPISLSGFEQLEFVFDLIYNPAHTSLLLEASKRGIPCTNGLYMLVRQAAEGSRIFTGTAIDDNTVLRVYRRLAMDSLNIVLIGMPGSGKTTLGEKLSEKLCRNFVDSDREIELKYHLTPAQIIASKGEDYFRHLELEMLKEHGKRTGSVISTGGGCVEMPEAYSYLKQNGLIIWLKRELSELSVDDRPISRKIGIDELYRRRCDKYARFADAEVQIKPCIENTLLDSVKAIEKYEETL